MSNADSTPSANATCCDPAEFRQGMRRLAAAVCVIATENDAGHRAGLTATAVCSVSATPPTLLVCVNRQNSSCEAIRDAGRFSVNALEQNDRVIAEQFAMPVSAEQKFSQGTWATLQTGAPVLQSAIVAFDCIVANTVDVGTHTIFFGQIAGLRYAEHPGTPLMYAYGEYGSFQTLTTALQLNHFMTPNWEYS
ncbi:flavin reductase family protein [Neopusillimonas aromaticivorans]|uniref:flavin reductase family protein n=1 Tax=Neopusillimonas aromaticivorans TaxID=2979868 RepID=UPI0025914AB2|nr:flavin reductase family protein [Neopusillimonas aromaticivorans]WJJ94495.1 flavin reductase family protein [Neopusillimonas aromaticivorans]